MKHKTCLLTWLSRQQKNILDLIPLPDSISCWLSIGSTFCAHKTLSRNSLFCFLILDFIDTENNHLLQHLKRTFNYEGKREVQNSWNFSVCWSSSTRKKTMLNDYNKFMKLSVRVLKTWDKAAAESSFWASFVLITIIKVLDTDDIETMLTAHPKALIMKEQR